MNRDATDLILKLNAEETAVLASVVSEALGTLREGIYKSETHAFREELKQREAILKRLLERLPTA